MKELPLVIWHATLISMARALFSSWNRNDSEAGEIKAASLSAAR